MLPLLQIIENTHTHGGVWAFKLEKSRTGVGGCISCISPEVGGSDVTADTPARDVTAVRFSHEFAFWFCLTKMKSWVTKVPPSPSPPGGVVLSNPDITADGGGDSLPRTSSAADQVLSVVLCLRCLADPVKKK